MLRVIVSTIVLTLGVAPWHLWRSVAEGSSGSSQSVIDSQFNARVANAAYARVHPRVLFDEAHSNADTAGGRYKPFVDLITSDGYRVTPSKRALSASVLAGYQVLVIVNPSGAPDQREQSAFTSSECDAVRAWVSGGGSLLLIIDHLPFTAAASLLSNRLGVELTRGYVVDKLNHTPESEDETELLFSRDNGLLGEHAITRGRDGRERIKRIVSFSGTSLKGPAGSVAFLKLADSAVDILPPDRKQTSPEDAPPDHRQVSAAGRAQGVAMQLGKGRVIVLGEAAMLTAQVTPHGLRFGMNAPGVDNRQLALNVMHWLSSLLK